MTIKKYLVNSVEEALLQIKEDLGNDAYILSTKKVIKSGSLNLGKKEMIEVTAANDHDPSKSDDNLSQALLNKKYGVGKSEGSSIKEESLKKMFVDNSILDKDKLTEFPDIPPAPPRPKPAAVQNQRPQPVPKDQNYDNMAFIKDELLPLKQEVEEIRLLLRQSGTDIQDKNIDFKGIYLEIFLDLMENGVNKKLAKKIVDTLVYQITGQPYNDRDIRKKVFNIIANFIGNPSPLRLDDGRRKVVVLVGPTGVGKTTTIAKLGSYYKLMESKRVALITNDNYRIGAEAHLSTYAKIINVPFYSVYDRKDLAFRLNELKNYDVIFVDTTGRSSEDFKGLEKIQQMIKGIPIDERETMLILSASTKSEDLHNIYEKYRIFDPEKFIFSKLDETMTLGNLFNLKMESDIPIAYFTTGQQVPEDIEIAYPRRFAGKILHKEQKVEEKVVNQASGLFKLTAELQGKRSGTKTYAITSGKGGVGKTNVTVNLAVSLADAGLRVGVVDADYGLGNISILLNIDPQYDLTDLFKKGKRIEDIVVEKNGINIIPAGSGIQSLSQLSDDEENILYSEMGRFMERNDVLILDTAAGISDNVISLLLSSDEIFLVVSPEPASIVDAYAVVKVVTELDSSKKFSVIANMVEDVNEASELYLKLSRATSKFLNKKIGTMGYVTKDNNLISSVRHQVPVVIKYPDSVCSNDLRKISKMIIKKVSSK